MSPHTVTGHLTGWTFHSSTRIALAWSHSAFTSASPSALHSISCSICRSRSAWDGIVLSLSLSQIRNTSEIVVRSYKISIGDFCEKTPNRSGLFWPESRRWRPEEEERRGGGSADSKRGGKNETFRRRGWDWFLLWPLNHFIFPLVALSLSPCFFFLSVDRSLCFFCVSL